MDPTRGEHHGAHPAAHFVTSRSEAHPIDLEGRIDKNWETAVAPGASTSFLENGHLGTKNKINRAAVGRRVRENNRAGEVGWGYTNATDKSQSHHEVLRMPTGNVLLIGCGRKTTQEVIDASRRADAITDHVLADAGWGRSEVAGVDRPG